MVDCYRKLRQGDTLGRSRSAYRITVRQLESMIRLSEALARLHCSDEIQPSYVREAYRLLKTSIIQVETSDVEVDEEDDDNDNGGGELPADQGSQEAINPGEYGGEEEHTATTTTAKDATVNDDSSVNRSEEPPRKRQKKEKKKTKISFEEYEAITNAIAGHLRTLEGDDVATYLTWDQVMEWYLNQCLEDIGDSLERMEEIKKKVNLVIRRLIDVDRILVTVGEAPTSKKDQGKTLLAVHPNYEIS